MSLCQASDRPPDHCMHAVADVLSSSLCSLNIPSLHICDHFVKKVVYEIRKCRQLQRNNVPLSGLCQTDPLTIVCCFRHALNSGVTTSGQLRAVPGMNLFLPGW